MQRVSEAPDDVWPRACDGCGREYDARGRGRRGPFHMNVRRADAESADRHRLVGHWRSGVWNPCGLVLLRRDGRAVTVLDARMHDLLAEGYSPSAAGAGRPS